MAKVVKRTFSLTEEQANFIDEKVQKGQYVSGSEVVREGLRGLQQDNAILENWIQREVVPALNELDAHPELARPADEVFDEILTELGQKAAPSRKRA